MDWNTLPDTFALTALVAVFASLLRRRLKTDLRLWLVGWVLIVLHFLAKLGNAGDRDVVLTALTIWALQLAAIAFIWAASERKTWFGFVLLSTLALPELAYTGLGVWQVQGHAWYVAAAVLIMLVPVTILNTFARSKVGDRLLWSIACALLGASLLFSLTFDSEPSDGTMIILAWSFLSAGIMYWRRFRRSTTGVLTTVLGFFAWGAVFPIAMALATWAPHLHIDETVYNIPKYVVAIGIIVTLLEEQMERANYLALHDPLTGLPNRRFFEDRLEGALERARRGGSHVAVLTIDLDRFKSINDSFGHHAGDEFLRIVAQRFARRVRKADVCARFGGDEFIVIAEQIGGRLEAEGLAAAMLEALREPIKLRGHEVVGAASIGIAMFPEDGLEPESLYAVSDQALYRTKRAHERTNATGEPLPR